MWTDVDHIVREEAVERPLFSFEAEKIGKATLLKPDCAI
jgi:hypothetical protein